MCIWDSYMFHVANWSYRDKVSRSQDVQGVACELLNGFASVGVGIYCCKALLVRNLL